MGPMCGDYRGTEHKGDVARFLEGSISILTRGGLICSWVAPSMVSSECEGSVGWWPPIALFVGQLCTYPMNKMVFWCRCTPPLAPHGQME